MGWHKLGRDDRVTQFTERIQSEEVLALDSRSGHIAGVIHGDLQRIGQSVGRADPMVAAIALQHRLPLATGNQKHYRRIVDRGHHLQLVNWRDEVEP